MDGIECMLRIEQMQKDCSRLADELAKMRDIQAKMMAELDCDERIPKLSKANTQLRMAMQLALRHLDALAVGENLDAEDGALLLKAQTTLETALEPVP